MNKGWISALQGSSFVSKWISIYFLELLKPFVALRPTLGHWKGDNLTRPMLITSLFDRKVTKDPSDKFESQSSTNRIGGIQM